MTAESHNNVFGRTLNPHKLTLTAGGSSGGEGALVAMRGSLLGIGTDIGGSIRIPALCCGVYGFKPSVGRIPYGGQTGPGRKGKEDFKACAGPLAVSQRDTELLFKAVIESDPWALDEAVIAAPFHPAPTKLRLRLGLILEDPKWPILPPVMRNLLAAVEKLKAAGHEVITLTDIPSIDEVTYLSFQYFNMDPAKTASGHIEAGGEPPIPSLAITVLKPEEYITPTLDATFGLNLERLEFKKKFRDLLLQNNLDAFICPSYQGPAAAHDTFGIPPYTVLFNLLDLPATVIPFGKAEAAKDAEFVRDVQYKPAYNAETYEGAPCSVQIVGRSFGDEKLLKDAEVIAKDLNG